VVIGGDVKTVSDDVVDVVDTVQDQTSMHYTTSVVKRL